MGLRKAGIVDGYTALKAAQRAAGKSSSPPVQDPSGEKKPSEELRKIGSHIGSTVMPTRYEVVCYECGFGFPQTGRPKNTFCPKCRTNLTFVDYTIDTEWAESLKTAGSITLTSEGVLKEGEIVATDIILEGRVEGGILKASRFLELRKGAKFKESALQCRDLKIAPEAKITLKSNTEYRNVEVSGSLKARLKTTGLITVKPGGVLRGEVSGAHLQVEEGGGLKAKLNIQAVEKN